MPVDDGTTPRPHTPQIEDLQRHIRALAKRKNAVIISHIYQRMEVQEVSDFIGDSLNLSKEAASTSADIIVFCGVHFMAETAKLLSPNKLVLLPDMKAGCGMADMITADQARAFKAEYPGRPLVSYVNTYAEVKAESDICCTSTNAATIVRSLPDTEILFAPDKFLGGWVQKRVPEKRIICWNGYCPTHFVIKAETVLARKQKLPNALVLAHPECSPEVLALADYVGSTQGIMDFAGKSDRREFIILTEAGLLLRLKALHPDKRFHSIAPCPHCPYMKFVELEKVAACLEDERNPIEIPTGIMIRARRSIERMLAVS
ncbi:MAG: quinolinate synthase [Candidatus Eremiobacter antarcticus]|nr:quinolinate synthase NadA [Candidatus Eremiobacteraeota bacterium]MBC5807485.1 quinolinate synthase NadA [Candidatus Eremiobacteraeota bacterium]PZR61499.1 MAG: quinolinate synthase [Candidatus Eremiobacter sp. RRmetagenome_bin22]